MDRLWTPWRYGYITGAQRPHRPGVPTALDAWPGQDTGCVFCNMLGAVEWAIGQGTPAAEAEQVAYILHRGPSTFLCLNAYPYSSGHVMAIPYAHQASYAELPRSTAIEISDTAQSSERLLRSVYRPDGLNLGFNLGEAAGAGVANHLHLHILPRWTGDTNFMTAIGETRILPETLDITWHRLRSALATLHPPLPGYANPESA